MTSQESVGGPGRLVLTYDGHEPEIAPNAFVAEGVTLVGAVTLRAEASVWYGTVIRADGAPIEVGAESNVQDGCVLHADPGYPVVVGARVSIGHGAVVHGCTVEDEVLIGMGAVVLNGAVIGRGSLVAAGSVLREGTVVPPYSLVTGVPAKVKRDVTDDERERMRSGVETYLARARDYRGGATA